MGQKTSRQMMRAKVTLPAGPCRVDTITVSYKKVTCWGQVSHRIARFTFPQQGWESMGGVQACTAKEEQCLSMAALQRKDGNTDIRVKCTSREAPVYTSSMSLARLLALLEEAGKGDAALLLFTIETEDDRTLTALSCNGWQWDSTVDAWERGDEEETQRPDHGEDGPVTQVDAGSGAADSRAKSASAEACGTVPEIDLPHPASLASLSRLALNDSVHWEPPPSVRKATVPGDSLDKSSSADVQDTVPEAGLGDPRSSTILNDLLKLYESVSASQPPRTEDHDEVTEVDLGDPSTLALLNDLLQVKETDLEDSSPSAEPHETVPAPDAQSATPPEERYWLDVFLDIAAALFFVWASVLMLEQVWHERNA